MRIRYRLLALSAVQTLTFLLALALQCHAGQAKLTWQDPNNTPAEVGGYKVYYWQTAWATAAYVNAGKQTSYTLTGLEEGKTYHFTVTAYDLSGGRESAYSNEVTRVIAGSPATSVLLEAHFETGTDGFGYRDDAFRGTAQPTYAAGDRNGGALRVTLGGVNDTLITNMSGGWRRTFTVSGSTTASVTLSCRYNLTQAANYESDESSDMLVTVGTQYLGTSGRVARLTGNGNGGSALTTGWRTFSTTLQLAPGTYTLTLGGYNNKKTYRDEVTTVLIDDVMVTVSSAALQGAVAASPPVAPVTAGSLVGRAKSSGGGTGKPGQRHSSTNTAAGPSRHRDTLATTETASLTTPAPAIKLWLEAETGGPATLLERGVDAEASAGEYLWVSDPPTPLDDGTFHAGLVRYTVSVPQTDTYVVWGRVSPEAVEAGDVMVTLKARKITTPPSDTSYALVWSPLVTEPSANPDHRPAWVWDQVARDTTPIVFLEAGKYTFTMQPQSRGIKIDQFLITNDLEYKP